MKLLLTIFTLALVTQSAVAEITIEPAGAYKAIRVESAVEAPIQVKFTTTIRTLDGCNHFGLSGDLRKVEVPEGTETLIQDFLADFAVFQTEMACPPLDEARVIELESQTFTIEPQFGSVYARFLVPEGFELIAE